MALANADIFKTTFVSGLLREERLLAERAALIHSDVTTALSQAVERFQPIATTLTQAFERIPTDHLVGLGRIGEELRPIALEYRQPDLSLSFTDLSEFGQPMLPYIEVEPRCLPLFEPQRRPPLDSYEWPAVPTDLQAKPASEIAQETEIYYRALLEKSELNAWEILDEHERRYTEEIEQAEWDLIEAEEAGDDETAKRMAHMKRIYIVKRRALRCSRRLYLSQVGLSSEQALEASHKVMKYNERTVMIGVALIGYLNMNRCLPDFQGQKEVFYKWCATVIGKGRTSVVNALTQSGCLVKGRRGSAGEGLEETIQHIIQYARRYQ